MGQLNILSGHVGAVMIATAWMAGIVLAKGFWLTITAICIPFYAWYLVVERLMILNGFGV